MLKGYIFDLGGTLIRFTGTWSDVMARSRRLLTSFLRSHGYAKDERFENLYAANVFKLSHRPEDDWVEYSAAYTIRLTLQQLSLPIPDSCLMSRAMDVYWASSEACWRPIDGAESTLHCLRSHGYKLALISNAPDEANVHRLLDLAGLKSFFSPIVVSATCGYRKPDPRIFRRVSDEWQFLPQSIVVVGDKLSTDVLGARLTGMRSVLVGPNECVQASILTNHITEPDLAVQKLDEVPQATIDKFVEQLA